MIELVISHILISLVLKRCGEMYRIFVKLSDSSFALLGDVVQSSTEDDMVVLYEAIPEDSSTPGINGCQRESPVIQVEISESF